MEKKEYIERGAILRKSETMFDGQKYCTAVNTGFIYTAPAADVVEVVHGEWIEHKSAFGGWNYDCPFCDDGFYMKERAKSKPNYCSNCGAKMDGERKEE